MNDHQDQTPLAVLENEVLCAVVAPSIGGRVTSLVHRASGREFLWRNPRLELAPSPPGSAYDPNFYGGMDELIPCDIPETIDGIDCPDHGELWTLALEAEADSKELTLHGRLPLYGLDYWRKLHLEDNRLVCDYRITNRAGAARKFLWKLHAALAAQPGDRILCPARSAQVADPDWSRRKSTLPFAWPDGGGLDMSILPEPDGSTEFLYLFDLEAGSMALAAQDGARMECSFDLQVFPCCWYFASHGGMDGAYTAVLEPCTSMPISVNQAAREGFCSHLQPGEALTTRVTWTVSVEDHGGGR